MPARKHTPKKPKRAAVDIKPLSADAEKALVAVYVLTGGKEGVSAPTQNIAMMCDRFSTHELMVMGRNILEKKG